jgi:outer membrane translocation and assembly module TamA
MEDWNNVVKILRYLKGTINYRINNTRKLGLEAFVDSDFAGDTETRKSMVF